ncbi:hypothetical protein V8G54_004577 [Vigna mungo]|uniref:Uncharacterized protein n=1 Tax=Vigna mungo TaxID=3915 RepID=A0AAQ3PGR6_VIGMU
MRLEELPHFPEGKFSELHFLLKEEEEERGGFPADETWERVVMWKEPGAGGGGEEEEGCFVWASAVREEMKEVAGEGVPSVLGIWCRGVAWKTGDWEGCVEGGGGGGGRGALRKRAWPVGVGVGVGVGAGPGPGPRSEMTFLNLETASYLIGGVVLLGSLREDSDELLDALQTGGCFLDGIFLCFGGESGGSLWPLNHGRRGIKRESGDYGYGQNGCYRFGCFGPLGDWTVTGDHWIIIEARIVVLEEQACGEWQCVGMEGVDWLGCVTSPPTDRTSFISRSSYTVQSLCQIVEDEMVLDLSRSPRPAPEVHHHLLLTSKGLDDHRKGGSNHTQHTSARNECRAGAGCALVMASTALQSHCRGASPLPQYRPTVKVPTLGPPTTPTTRTPMPDRTVKRRAGSSLTETLQIERSYRLKTSKAPKAEIGQDRTVMGWANPSLAESTSDRTVMCKKPSTLTMGILSLTESTLTRQNGQERESSLSDSNIQTGRSREGRTFSDQDPPDRTILRRKLPSLTKTPDRTVKRRGKPSLTKETRPNGQEKGKPSLTKGTKLDGQEKGEPSLTKYTKPDGQEKREPSLTKTPRTNGQEKREPSLTKTYKNRTAKLCIILQNSAEFDKTS